jgi:hypothetical protein
MKTISEKEVREINPSEKPGERQRARLIADEPSGPVEPRLKRGGNVATPRDPGLGSATRIEPSRGTLISTRYSR